MWCSKWTEVIKFKQRKERGKKHPNGIHLQSSYYYTLQIQKTIIMMTIKKSKGKKQMYEKNYHDLKALNFIFICCVFVGDSVSDPDSDVVTESSLPGIIESPYFSPNPIIPIIPIGFLRV